MSNLLEYMSIICIKKFQFGKAVCFWMCHCTISSNNLDTNVTRLWVRKLHKNITKFAFIKVNFLYNCLKEHIRQSLYNEIQVFFFFKYKVTLEIKINNLKSTKTFWNFTNELLLSITMALDYYEANTNAFTIWLDCCLIGDLIYFHVSMIN